MNLKGIIAISGRPGLFKVVTQGKNNVIVESMIDKKRFPAGFGPELTRVLEHMLEVFEWKWFYGLKHSN